VILIRIKPLHGGPTIEHRLDPVYTLHEVQQEIDAAIEGQVQVRLMLEDGQRTAEFDPRECEVVSIADLAVLDP